MIKQDQIEKKSYGIIHHGSESNRVYVLKFDPKCFPQMLVDVTTLANNKGYGKIIVKTKPLFKELLEKEGYKEEAMIPGFDQGQQAVHFMCTYLDSDRQKVTDKADIREVLETVLHMQTLDHRPPLDGYILRRLDEADILEMVALYEHVFETYPFPIHNPAYIKETMDGHVLYFGAFYEGDLVGIASSEQSLAEGNAEMTDFAVDPKHRGRQLAYHLLMKMEAHMIEKGMQTLYTIARAKSYGMNGTFKKAGYHYTGTLYNNTQIGGQIESMHVWYKSLAVTDGYE